MTSYPGTEPAWWSGLAPQRDVSAAADDSQADEEAIAEAWELGELSWLLNEQQLAGYQQYREWELLDPAKQAGQYTRIFVLDWGRRVGKTFKRMLVRSEDCIRHPGRFYRYASAFQKNIDEIVNGVSRDLFDTCPDHLRPRYATRQGVGTGFFFPNGSVLRLVGLDKDPDGLRGRASDGDDISEAAFVRHLVPTVKNVLYAQYQGRPWARMCTESSGPLETDGDYDKEIVEDAKTRKAYSYATIDDNTRLSDEEREEFIRAAGGREHPDCQREYFNVRVRDPQSTVVPEFNAAKHVGTPTPPKYAYAFCFADPGTRDLFGLVWCYWDWELQILVVQRSWAERNAGTSRVIEVCREVERELWGSGGHGVARDAQTRRGGDEQPPGHETPAAALQYFDGRSCCPNPYMRVADIDLTFMTDSMKDHGVVWQPADKSRVDSKDAGSAAKTGEANLYLLRGAFNDGVIEIWPDSGPLQAQLEGGRWNEQRTDFDRSRPALGHLDCMKALAYGYRKAVLPIRNLNPFAPKLPESKHGVFMPPKPLVSTRHEALNRAMGVKRKWR